MQLEFTQLWFFCASLVSEKFKFFIAMLYIYICVCVREGGLISVPEIIFDAAAVISLPLCLDRRAKILQKV
jgi:hypothetical protein